MSHDTPTTDRLCCAGCEPCWNAGHWLLSCSERTTFFGVCSMCGALLGRRFGSQGVLSARSILMLAALRPDVYRDLTYAARDCRLQSGRISLPYGITDRFTLPPLPGDDPPPRSHRAAPLFNVLLRLATLFHRLTWRKRPRTTTARAGTHGRVAS